MKQQRDHRSAGTSTRRDAARRRTWTSSWRVILLALTTISFVATTGCDTKRPNAGSENPESKGDEPAGAPAQPTAEEKRAAEVKATSEKLGPSRDGAAISASAGAVTPTPKPVAPDGTVIEPCPDQKVAGMSCVGGGGYLRGLDDDTHSPSCKQSSYNKKETNNVAPASEVWVQSFYMDITEVTTEAYKACVADKKCDKAGPKYVDFSRDKQPITGISWYDANKFCQAQGKHLPTEVEWERAARGPDNTMYPWGNEPEPSCDNAVIMNAKGERSCGTEKRGSHPEKGRVLEVCSKPPGHYGLCDMVGNAEEWVFDWYSNGWEPCGEDCQGTNPMGPCKGEEPCQGHRYKLVRGGSWYWPKEHATGVHRRSHVASNNPYHHFGFRCAATLEEAAAIAASTEPTDIESNSNGGVPRTAPDSDGDTKTKKVPGETPGANPGTPKEGENP